MNLRLIRKFFLGVLGWTPADMRREASLDDLLEAWLGYAEFHNLLKPCPPDKAFLLRMMQLFPDKYAGDTHG